MQQPSNAESGPWTTPALGRRETSCMNVVTTEQKLGKNERGLRGNPLSVQSSAWSEKVASTEADRDPVKVRTPDSGE